MIPTQTPSGWRTDQLSMPRPTCSVNSPVKEFEPRCLQNLCCCGKISIGVLLFYRLLDRYDILTRHPGIGSAYEEVKLPEVATLVPGVVGQSIGQANAGLTRAGFSVHATIVRGRPPRDAVVSQDPRAGARSHRGGTVRLSVSDGVAG